MDLMRSTLQRSMPTRNGKGKERGGIDIGRIVWCLSFELRHDATAWALRPWQGLNQKCVDSL